MTERRHPGPHPDADRLNAFMEGALTEQERQESLAHLAECAECRSIVFLAQQAVPAPPPRPAVLPAWRLWRAPLSLAAAALACGLIVILWTRPHSAPKLASNNVAVARQTAPPSPPVSTATPEAAPTRPAANAGPPKQLPLKKPAPAVPTLQAPPAAPEGITGGLVGSFEARAAQPAAKQAAPAVASDQPQTAAAAGKPGAPPSIVLKSNATGAAQQALGNVAAMHANSVARLATLTPPPVAAGPLVQAPRQNGFLASADTLHLTIEHNQGPDNGFSAIRGTVTDLSGAVVPRATVMLRSTAGETTATTTTGADGRFALSSVAPGQYELQISATGFMTSSHRLDLQARDLALLSPTLKVGAASQTVQVVSAGSELAPAAPPATPPATPMTDAELDEIVPALPGKAAAATTVVKNGRIVALDKSGTLYLSRNAGKHWKKIKPVWSGTIVQLVLAPPAESSADKGSAVSGISISLFELTTSNGALWVSSDGAHWRLR